MKFLFTALLLVLSFNESSYAFSGASSKIHVLLTCLANQKIDGVVKIEMSTTDQPGVVSSQFTLADGFKSDSFSSLAEIFVSKVLPVYGKIEACEGDGCVVSGFIYQLRMISTSQFVFEKLLIQDGVRTVVLSETIQCTTSYE